MSPRAAGANAKRSAVRVRVEHVFAQQKDQMGLFIRTIGLRHAKVKVGLANLVYNIDRLIFYERGAAMGWLRPARNFRDKGQPKTARSNHGQRIPWRR